MVSTIPNTVGDPGWGNLSAKVARSMNNDVKDTTMRMVCSSDQRSC